MPAAPHVTGLLVKPVPHGPMRVEASVDAVTHHGLDGDCHAGALGPRQVLLVRQEDLTELGVQASQLRANIVVAALPDGAAASGTVLGIGDHARIRVTHACEICGVLRPHLDTAAFRRLPGRRGVLGVVLAGGRLRVGDTVRPERERRPAVPDRMGDRAAWVIARIPRGRVLTYAGLITLAGGQRAHFRVLPAYVRSACALGLPGHRVVTSAGAVTPHVEGQAALLRGEGVPVDAAGTVADAAAWWNGDELFR